MKLYYHEFEDGSPNFGDSLNVWLWGQLLPDVLDDDARSRFVGIGTLLNNHLDDFVGDADRLAIFSSGVGYFDGPTQLSAHDKVYCVRGPLSAQALGLPDRAAVTDGAVLVRRLVQPAVEKVFQFSFMPHIEMLADTAWEQVCDDLGFGYIDPRWPTEKVLNLINGTEVLLAEAMHGAIVADALRVPWIPVTTKPDILEFKWRDWCATVGIEYKPMAVTQLFNPRRKVDLLLPARKARYWAKSKMAGHQLAQIAAQTTPSLSTDERIENLTQELENRLDMFRNDERSVRKAA